MALPLSLVRDIGSAQFALMLFGGSDPQLVEYQNNGVRGHSLVCRTRLQSLPDYPLPCGTGNVPRLLYLEFDLDGDELEYEAKVLRYLQAKVPEGKFYARHIHLLRVPSDCFNTLRDTARMNDNQNAINRRLRFLEIIARHVQGTARTHMFVHITERAYASYTQERQKFNNVPQALLNTTNDLQLLRAYLNFYNVLLQLRDAQLSHQRVFALIYHYRVSQLVGNVLTSAAAAQSTRVAREPFVEIFPDGEQTPFFRNWRHACLFGVQRAEGGLRVCQENSNAPLTEAVDLAQVSLLFAEYQEEVDVDKKTNLYKSIADAYKRPSVRVLWPYHQKQIERTVEAREILGQQRRDELASESRILTTKTYFSALSRK